MWEIRQGRDLVYVGFNFVMNPEPSLVWDQVNGCLTHGRLIVISCSRIAESANIARAAAGFENLLDYTDFI